MAMQSSLKALKPFRARSAMNASTRPETSACSSALNTPFDTRWERS